MHVRHSEFLWGQMTKRSLAAVGWCKRHKEVASRYGCARIGRELLFLLLSSALLAGSTAHGLEGALRFARLAPEDGLSGPEIYAAGQDAAGFLWFVTGEGLDRFDGHSIETYHYAPDDSRAVPESSIRFLFTDSTGSLWVSTASSGLFRLHPDIDGFERLRPGIEASGQPAVLTLCERGDGALWVGTDRGLEIWDRETGSFEPQTAGVGRSPLDDLRVVGLERDGEGPGLWIGTSAGLYVLEFPTGAPRKVPLPELDQQMVWRVKRGVEGDLWLAVESEVFHLTPDGERIARFAHDPADPGTLSGGLIHDLLMDSAGVLWVASENGLSTYDSTRDRFVRHQHALSDPSSISHDTVYDLFEDRTGVLWMSTLDGVSFWDRGREQFVTFRSQKGRASSLAAFDVWSVVEDREGSLWIAFGPQGLDRYDRDRDEVEHFVHDPEDSGSLQEGSISVVYEDGAGTIWVGANGGGLSRLDREAGRFEHFRHDPSEPATLTHDDVQKLLEDRTGRLWIGTRGGLSVRDPDSGAIVRLPRDESQPEALGSSSFVSMVEDPDGGLWFGSLGTGLFHRLPGSEEGRPAEIRSLYAQGRPGFVVALHWYSAGGLWAGTADGLAEIGPDGEVRRRITRRDGLPGKQVRGLLEDRTGRLWLSSNHGLSRFDPTTGEIRNWDRHDGLQGNAFSTKAEFRSPSGEMFFGGWRGLSAFYPERITDDSHPPQVAFSDFRLQDRSMGPRAWDPESPLEVAIQRAEHVELGPDAGVFGVELAALHFAAPAKNRFLYQLEGAGDEWVPLEARQRYLQFSNLAPGKYRLRVKASNKDGVWSEEAATLGLTVLPPWWSTGWAYGGYALLALGAIGLYSRQQRKRLEQERAIADQERKVAERERAAGQRLRRVDQLKDEFLANTSHELRTPLYGMTGLAESLLEGAQGSVPKEMQADLEMIASSGRRLSRLVNDLLDFSKLRHQSLELDPRPVDLRSAVDVVLTLIRPLADTGSLALQNLVPVDLPAIAADEDRLQQILHNLVGNAVKFTEQGRVVVAAEVDGDVVEIRVEDTGPGIAAEARLRIFEAFEQADASVARSFEGTGLGLTVARQLVELHGGRIWVESKPGQGARFVFRIPLFEAASSPRELEDGRGVEEALAPAVPPGREPSAVFASKVPPAEASEDSASRAGPSLEGVRILAVDDDPVNLRVLESYLTHEGSSLVLVDHGEEALRLLREQTFDLVLLDVMMPKISGYEVCRELRRTYSLEELPVIFLSALSQSSEVIAGLEQGGNDFLSKPVSKGELLARIRPHLELVKIHRGLEDLVNEKVSEIKVLQGLLPICASCKKIRDEEGTWNELEAYVHRHSEAEFTHSVCPTCVAELYPEMANRVKQGAPPTA